MIGERIKILRKEKKLFQKDLAEKLNLTQQTISLYEANKRDPDYETLNIIAKFFNVSLDYLMGNSEIRNPYKDNEGDFTEEELKILEKIKNDPEISILFHDLKSAPKKKIKQLIETWEFINKTFDDMEDEE